MLFFRLYPNLYIIFYTISIIYDTFFTFLEIYPLGSAPPIQSGHPPDCDNAQTPDFVIPLASAPPIQSGQPPGQAHRAGIMVAK
jgi:hypothetical protein